MPPAPPPLLTTCGSNLCTSSAELKLPGGDVEVQLFSYASTLEGGADAARAPVPCLTIAAKSAKDRTEQQQWMMRLHEQLQCMTAAYKLFKDPSEDTLTLDKACASPENLVIFNKEAGKLKTFLRNTVFETWVSRSALHYSRTSCCCCIGTEGGADIPFAGLDVATCHKRAGTVMLRFH